MIHVPEDTLNSFIKKKKFKNILIITGKKTFNTSGFKKLEVYKNFKFIMKVLYKKKKIPEFNELKILIKKINIINPDLILALGGGCVLDYSKLANTLYNVKNLKNKIKTNLLKVDSKKTKILAIPTTAGSGAEVTRFSVIYINKIKYSVECNLMKPDFYSLVPKLAITSPKLVRASSGFDSIAQALECMFSKKANVHSIKYSSKSLVYSIKNFLGFVNSPNLANAYKMLMAANFSGKAINIAKTNAPHALSYLFTSKYKIPHGIAVSIFFIEIINFYFFSALREKNKKLITRFRLLFKIFSINNLNQFNIFFNKIFIKSGIKKYLNESLKNLRYKKKFYFDLERLNNSPFNISKDYINNLYSNKLKF